MTGKSIPTLLLLATAITSALTAGVFYAFSSFVMAGLGKVPADQGANAMNAINVTVITPSFMILFMGTTLLCTLLGGWSLFSFSDLDSKLILTACLAYLIGCFGVTMAFNVPLNDQLAAASPAEIGAIWQNYLRIWTRWNTVRTIAPAISAILLIIVLMRR
jgi:uncharacterized membrane protein